MVSTIEQMVDAFKKSLENADGCRCQRRGRGSGHMHADVKNLFL